MSLLDKLIAELESAEREQIERFLASDEAADLIAKWWLKLMEPAGRA